ncbi:hypothetical protein E2C01_068095 [Portunus trituberculatus]|uniref:Uncharacterized protein n=1 Tax=Portunus trituberculatus TaxID=210409 RepID=A0A5B7HYJ7_PORTR|nr:hypothetical protein [Portunus trituberculatus]
MMLSRCAMVRTQADYRVNTSLQPSAAVQILHANTVKREGTKKLIPDRAVVCWLREKLRYMKGWKRFVHTGRTIHWDGLGCETRR